jgi:transcriptional regulator with AAA-type ATPase domain
MNLKQSQTLLLTPLLDRLETGGNVAALHRAAGEALVRHHGRNAAAVADQVAHHFEAAGLPDAAAGQYLAAAAHRRDQGQVSAACELLEKADAKLPPLGDKSAVAAALDALVGASGKMQLLHKLVTRLREEGRKVLIFSQVRVPPDCSLIAL